MTVKSIITSSTPSTPLTPLTFLTFLTFLTSLTLLAFFSLLSLSSCQKPVKIADREIDIYQVISLKESDLNADQIFEKMTFIHPENVKDGLIGRYFNARIYQDYLILSNEDLAVQVYDKNGKFIFSTTKGEGPGEHFVVSDFTIDEEKGEICVLDGTKRQVLRFTMTGQFLGSFPVKRATGSLSWIGKGRFAFFVPFNYHIEDGVNYDFLHISDSTGEVYASKKMRREIKESPWVSFGVFSPQAGGPVFQLPTWDTLIRVTPAGFENYMALKFGELKMPEKYYETIELHRKYVGNYVNAWYLPAGDKTFITYSYSIKQDYGSVFQDPAGQIMLRARNPKGEKPGMRFGQGDTGFCIWPKSVNTDNTVMMDCEMEKVQQFLKEYKTGNNQFYDTTWDLLKQMDQTNDNPLIIIGYLK